MNASIRDPIIADEEVSPGVTSNQAVSEGGTPYEVLSMASFDKSHDGVFDYNTPATRPGQASDFASFAPSTFEGGYINPTIENPHLMTGGFHDTHDYNRQFYAARPEIISYGPQQGAFGGKVHITVATHQDLHEAIVLFGSRRCSGLITRAEQPGTFNITVDVPQFETTGLSTSAVPLYLECQDGVISFGHYTYLNSTPFGSPASSRKRKMSPEDHTTEKRIMRGQDYDAMSSSPLSSTALSPYSATQAPVNYAYGSSRSSAYNASTPRYGISPQPSLQHLAPTSDYPQYIQDRPGVSTSVASYSPGMTGGPSSAPTLVRTSTLPDTGSPHSISQPFAGQYMPMYSATNKAVLKIEGDLMTMTDNWNSDEVSTQRRLVRFRRAQVGSTITAMFEPVTLEDHARAPGNIYVNCIYWKEKGSCFITSVDTIQLLESLVAVRFTVEEKNRIRRNLEGFRPATVSKTRPECEEFFKTIMGFPSPKPRNIEKDVKVFPWKILSHALKKIIGKYSASYNPGGMSTSMNTTSSPSPMLGVPRHTASPALIPPTSMPTQVSMPPTSIGQSMSWAQPPPVYTADMSAGRPAWDFGHYIDPNAAGQQIRYERVPSISQSMGFAFGMPGDFRPTQA